MIVPHILLEMVFLGNAIVIAIGLWLPMKPVMVEEQNDWWLSSD